ncbi:MAG: acyl-peptide hydrolase [Fimbriimonadales bacterium]
MARRPIAAEDLLELVYLGDPQLSPDTKKIAFCHKTVDKEKNKYRTHIWVSDVETGASRQFTFGEESEGSPRWSPDGKYLAFVAAREKPKAQIYLLPTDGGEAFKLTDLEEGSIAGIEWSPDSTRIAFAFRPTAPEWTEKAQKEREEKGLSTPPRIITDIWYRLDGDGYFVDQHHQLHVVDLATREVKKLTDERYGAQDFCWAPDGKRLCFVVNRSPEPSETPQLDDLMILDVDTGAESKLEGLPEGPKHAPAWSKDGTRIAYVGHLNEQDWWSGYNNRIYVADASGQGASDLFGTQHDYSVGGSVLGDSREASFGAKVFWSKDGTRLFFSLDQHGSTHVCSIPAEGGELRFHTEGRGLWEVGDTDGAGTFALTVASATRPAEVAVAKLDGDDLQVRTLTDFNGPLFEQLAVCEPEPFWIESEPGQKVHGWVLKPHGFEQGKRYPCALEIHGGPHAQYGETFFHEFQLLAAQGYVVVYSNPRGSRGYGEAHTRAISGDWGNADYVDLMAVADHAASLPFVDPSRMAVMGGSYGGYMTNWIVGHTDRFRTAITDRSVVSLLSFAGTCDFAFIPDTEWKGNAWDEIEDLWRQSPLKYAKNVKTPTLIIHSEGDLRCPIEQAEQLFSAFKRLGVETKFVRYPLSTSHGLSRSGPPDLRLHRLGQIVDWLDKYLKA